MFSTCISSQLILKPLHNVFTASQDWSVKRLWDVWNESCDDRKYDVVKTSHEAITSKSHYDVFTTSKRLSNLLSEAAIVSICVHWDNVCCVSLKYKHWIIGETTLIVIFHQGCFTADIWLKSWLNICSLKLTRQHRNRVDNSFCSYL